MVRKGDPTNTSRFTYFTGTLPGVPAVHCLVLAATGKPFGRGNPDC
jgi:hypothetical protein